MTQELVTAFNHLKPQLQRIWAEIQAWQQADDLANAPRFNIFKLLGVAYLEDQTHSPFLANLLNPRGSHGQGFLFLSTFLQRCARKWPQRPFLLSDDELQTGHWHIRREVGFNLASGYKGFMDIVLSNHDLRCVIVIENKIYAGEQTKQLSRYSRWLESTYPHYDQALIFLTPDGRAPRSGRAHLFSYQQDIVAWLEATLHHIQATNVQAIIKQYLAIIEAREEMTMSQNNLLLELILQPDNLPLIRAVTKQFDTFRANAHWHFWQEFGRALQTKFDSSDYTDVWELRQVEQKHVTKSWHGCYLQPKKINKNQAQLRFAFRQGPPNLPQFYFGIRWMEGHPDPSFTDFKTQLHSSTTSFPMRTDEPNWPIFHRFTFGPTSDEFLIRMYQSPETLIAQVADAFWDLFRRNATTVAAINAQQVQSIHL